MHVLRRTIVAVVACAALAACQNQPASNEAQPTFAKPTITDKTDAKLAALLPADVRKRGTVTIAVNPDVPPVKYLGDDNDVQGLIVDLLRQAGARLGLEVSFDQTSFDALIPGLNAERYDMIASVGDFEERQETIDFIDYMKSGVALLVLKDNPEDIHGPKDLCGTKIAFVRGTFQQDLVAKADKDCRAKGEEPVEHNGYQDSGGAELALRSGQADAAWLDSPDAGFRAKKNPDRYAVAHTFFTGPYGIGIPKADPKLTKAYRAALLSMAEDGSYQAAMKRYGLADAAIPTFPLNTGPKQEA